MGYRPWGHKESNTTEQLTHTGTQSLVPVKLDIRKVIIRKLIWVQMVFTQWRISVLYLL